VQDSRLRIWIDAREQRFGSFVELNAWLASRCRSLWEEVRHPDYRELSVAEVFEQERAHLMPMPTPFDGYVERAARVSSTCLVVIGRNRYSVPCEFAGQMLSTRLYPGRVVVVGDDAMVAEHGKRSIEHTALRDVDEEDEVSVAASRRSEVDRQCARCYQESRAGSVSTRGLVSLVSSSRSVVSRS